LHTFFHPDYTVGPGVSPDRARRAASVTGQPAAARGLYRRSGIGLAQVELRRRPHPAPKVVVCN